MQIFETLNFCVFHAVCKKKVLPVTLTVILPSVIFKLFNISKAWPGRAGQIKPTSRVELNPNVPAAHMIPNGKIMVSQ